MRRLTASAALLAAALLGCAHADCRDSELAVQVLGAGGPVPDLGRASSAYLIWHEGRSRALIDAGGGSYVRFAEAEASFEELELVALSHLHVDHVADLPALLKGGFFGARERPLVVAGPSGGGQFPGVKEWLELQLGPGGAYRYLDWQLDPDRGAWTLDARELDAASRSPMSLELDADLRVTAIGVRHGPVPALAYRVEIAGRTIVFAGDQTGDDPSFVEFARGADLLIMHLAVGEQPDPVAAKLHARPSEIAEIAAAAEAEALLLSHLMARSVAELDRSRASIGARYDGAVSVAEDLGCHRL